MLANKTLSKTLIRLTICYTFAMPLLYICYAFITILSENADFVFFANICYDSKARLYKSLSQKAYSFCLD